MPWVPSVRWRAARGCQVATARVDRPLTLRVDGATVDTRLVDRGESLLSVLRRTSHPAAKLACGRGECGACTVLVGDRPVMACTRLADTVDCDVTTAAGLDADDLRESFADHVGFQCGFCTPGQIVRAESVLRESLYRTRDDVTYAMAGNICRCTGYVQIIDAVMEVLVTRRGQETPCTPLS